MAKVKVLASRRDTAANFNSLNPILDASERAYETDTKRMKIGDGTTAYNSLPYSPIKKEVVINDATSWSTDSVVYDMGTILIDSTNRLMRIADGVNSFVNLDDFPARVGGGDASNA